MKNIQFYENINPNITYTMKSVSSYWNKDQIIRFLYRNLANYVYRDLHYFLQDANEKQRQYSSGFINRFPGVVCYTLAEFYCASFEEFGIESKIVQANSASISLYGVVAKGDYGYYFLNPLEDLFLNQYGLRPCAFGYIPKYKTLNNNCPDLVRLSDGYLLELDKSLDFVFLDDEFKKLKIIFKDYLKACSFLKIENPPLDKDIREEKIKYTSDNLINIGNVNGIFERAQLYQFLNETLLDKRERNHVKVLIEDGLSDNPFISYTIKKSDGDIVYKEEKTTKGYVLIRK